MMGLPRFLSCQETLLQINEIVQSPFNNLRLSEWEILTTIFLVPHLVSYKVLLLVHHQSPWKTGSLLFQGTYSHACIQLHLFIEYGGSQSIMVWLFHRRGFVLGLHNFSWLHQPVSSVRTVWMVRLKVLRLSLSSCSGVLLENLLVEHEHLMMRCQRLILLVLLRKHVLKRFYSGVLLIEGRKRPSRTLFHCVIRLHGVSHVQLLILRVYGLIQQVIS